ncbi:MAG: CopG family transcriptional regulator [Ramlibacter sp.]
MDEKARLTVLIDPVKKKAFDDLCTSKDTTSSQMVRLLIRQYLEKHGIEWDGAASKRPRIR